MILGAPVCDQRFRGIQSRVVVEQADPKRGQRTKTTPRTAVGAAHLEIFLQPDFREYRGDVIGPIADAWKFAGQERQPASHEIPERHSGGIKVLVVAVDKIHRNVEQIVYPPLEAEALFEDER